MLYIFYLLWKLISSYNKISITMHKRINRTRLIDYFIYSNDYASFIQLYFERFTHYSSTTSRHTCQSSYYIFIILTFNLYCSGIFCPFISSISNLSLNYTSVKFTQYPSNGITLSAKINSSWLSLLRFPFLFISNSL